MIGNAIFGVLFTVLGAWGTRLYFRPGEAEKWPRSTSPAIGFLGALALFAGSGSLVAAIAEWAAR